MFWTESDIQPMLFRDLAPEIVGADARVAELIRYFLKPFGEDPSSDAINFARFQALLTVKPTQDLLRPLLDKAQLSPEDAKPRFVHWMRNMFSLETFARSTRANGSEDGRIPSLRRRDQVEWYQAYVGSDHFKSVKAQATELWQRHFGSVSCCVNARHGFNSWHHSDYGRLGCNDEAMTLRPMCQECHVLIRQQGPGLPLQCPELVRRWL